MLRRLAGTLLGSTTLVTALAASVAQGATPSGELRPMAPATKFVCTQTVSSATAATIAVSTAAPDAVICLTGGSYPGLVLSGAHSGDVTVQPVPGAAVTITAGLTDIHRNHPAVYVRRGSSHIVLVGFDVSGAVEVDQGASFVRIDHNDIHDGFQGVVLSSVDCTVAHAPRWNGCQPQPPVTDVIISNNRIHGFGRVGTDDALNLNNWQRVRITGNEIYDTVQGTSPGSPHTDCLQSTFGGSDLIFDHNYEHDNQCQGFFLKDGDVTNAYIYDNLFLRDQARGLSGANLQVIDTYGLVMRSNTNWSGNFDVLRADVDGYAATVDHNLSFVFGNGCCSMRPFTLSEYTNVFGRKPWTFKPDSSDSVVAAPSFMDPAADDYRLAVNPNGVGIDWRPRDQAYGQDGLWSLGIVIGS